MRKSTIALLLCVATLGGCYVYDPYYPYGYPAAYPGGGTAATYNQAWNAALGAMRDQGVQVGREDRASGVIQGTRGGANVAAQVITQADGRVRVEFNVANDAALAEGLSRSYDARMGR
jgi:hypothetical protein